MDLAPRVPEDWGRLNVTRLRLGAEVVHVHAHPDGASVSGLPEGWAVGEPAAPRGEPHEATVTSHPPRPADPVPAPHDD